MAGQASPFCCKYLRSDPTICNWKRCQLVDLSTWRSLQLLLLMRHGKSCGKLDRQVLSIPKMIRSMIRDHHCRNWQLMSWILHGILTQCPSHRTNGPLKNHRMPQWPGGLCLRWHRKNFGATISLGNGV